MYWISHSNLKGPLLYSLWKGLLMEFWASDLWREGDGSNAGMKEWEVLTESPAWHGTHRPWCSGSLWCPRWARSYSEGWKKKISTKERPKNGTKWKLHWLNKCSAIRWRQSTSAELSKGVRLVTLLCWKAIMTHMSCKFCMSLKSIEVQSREKSASSTLKYCFDSKGRD